MSTYYGPDCTCYHVWHSITPPPPCPVHRGYAWTTYTPRVTSASSLTSTCRGRHCAHDAGCFPYTVNWTGQ